MKENRQYVIVLREMALRSCCGSYRWEFVPNTRLEALRSNLRGHRHRDGILLTSATPHKGRYIEFWAPPNSVALFDPLA